MSARRESGAVLLVVLVALALLAALAGVALRIGQSGLMGLASERAEFQRQVLMQSALSLVGARLGDPRAIPRDGTPVVLILADGRVEVRVQAAEGLANPAHVRLPILQALLTRLGGSPEQALRLTRAIAAARNSRTIAGPADLAPVFAADMALWRKVQPFFTYLGNRTTVDPATAPGVLRFALMGAMTSAVDLTQTAGTRGLYEIDMRILAEGETIETGQGLYTHSSVLRDAQGRIHVFFTSWPQEIAG